MKNWRYFAGYGSWCLVFLPTSQHSSPVQFWNWSSQCFAILKHFSLLPTLTSPVRQWVEVDNAHILLQDCWFGCILMSATNYTQEICNLFVFWQIRLQSAASWQEWSAVLSLNTPSRRNFWVTLFNWFFFFFLFSLNCFKSTIYLWFCLNLSWS